LKVGWRWGYFISKLLHVPCLCRSDILQSNCRHARCYGFESAAEAEAAFKASTMKGHVFRL
jgi:hypothetical protein